MANGKSLKEKFKNLGKLFYEVGDKWSADKAPKLGAALSFYTIFSLAPLLIIAIAVAGMVFGNEAAQGEIVYQIRDLVGEEGAKIVQTAIKNASEGSSDVIATIISMATLVIASTAVFVELQDSLNKIWRVKRREGNVIKQTLRERLTSFGMVVGFGFLLLVSLLVSALLTGLKNFISSYVDIPFFVLEIFNILISIGVIFVLFTMIYKVLPDVHLAWKDVWRGGLVTTLLFVLGKYLIGLYLGTSSYASTYGAAGSLAILLIWIYYSAQIVFLGAEFAYVLTVRYGKGIVPSSNAEKVKDCEEDEGGIE